MSGLTRASSAASIALSVNSFTTTLTNASGGWPVIAASSWTLKYSAAREISKVARSHGVGVG
jgi:hypothetical protein